MSQPVIIGFILTEEMKKEDSWSKKQPGAYNDISYSLCYCFSALLQQ